MTGIWLRRAVLLSSLLVLILLYIHSCVPEPITDLKLVKVQRLSAAAFPREAHGLREALARRGEVVWKLSLAGNSNWIGEVKQHDLNSYATVVRCDERDYGIDAFGPYIGAVAVTTQGDALDRFEPASDTLQYDIYLIEAGRYRSQEDFNATMPSYDLHKQRLPLCITIAGGAMHGAYNRSNEVRAEVGGGR